MKSTILFGLALGLAIVSILLFMAGQVRFGILAPNHANFAGTSAILASGFFWVLWGMSGRKKEE